jgi:chemotaxis protein CheD
MAQTHVVGISDCKTAREADDTIVTYGLGSCVGLALFDPDTSTGGLLHVMLPDSRYCSASGEFNPHRYADTGFRSLLDQVCALGADKGRLCAKLVGGADMLGQSPVFAIGEQNAEALVGLCRREGIPIAATSLGGTLGRAMEFRLSDGAVRVKLLGRGEEML